MNQMAGIIEQHQVELARLITREQGKTLSGPGSMFEAGGCRGWTQVTASLKLETELVDDNPEETIELVRKPIGVVGSITPWNWPLLIAVWHIMPAIRVGCTVVLKTASYTPLSTLRLVELLNDVLPPGVLNVVPGSSGVFQQRCRGVPAPGLCLGRSGVSCREPCGIRCPRIPPAPFRACPRKKTSRATVLPPPMSPPMSPHS